MIRYINILSIAALVGSAAYAYSIKYETMHYSAEIVKQFLSTRAGRGQARSRLLPGEPIPPAPTFELVGKQPVIAGAEETARNPRARSAKLRIAQRTNAPARGLDDDLLALVSLPERGERRR